MKALFNLTIYVFTMVGAQSQAQMKLGGDTTVVFATIDEARQILTNQDDFIRRLSPFDRAARMKTSNPVSEEVFLNFVGTNVLAWNDAERQKVASAFRGIQTELEALSLPLPQKLFVIKTTGDEEGKADYTRANAIVIPKDHLTAPTADFEKIISHELFHVLSRANPDLREAFYAAIGFAGCSEVAFPVEMKQRKITNPDAPRNDHCVRLQVDGKACWAIPLLFSSAEKYDPGRGGEFFDYLQFQFLLVDRDENTSRVKPIYEGQKPKLVEVGEGSGFFEQVGRNTQYIIHPEEILADNFSLLVLQRSNLPSPAIIKKMEVILKQRKISGTRSEPPR